MEQHPAPAPEQSTTFRVRQAFQRASLLFEVQKYAEALQETRLALSLDPDNAKLHRMAAACLVNLKDNRGAMTEVRQALSLDPEYAAAYRLLAILHSNRKHFAPAFQAIDNALRLAPGNPVYLTDRARFLLLKREFKDALTTVDAALHASPESEAALHLRAEILRVMGRAHESSDLTNQVLSRNPEDAIAWHQRGLQLSAEGKIGEAKYALLQALAINPEMPNAQRALLLVIGGRHSSVAVCWSGWLLLRMLPNVLSWYLIIFILVLPILMTLSGRDTAAQSPDHTWVFLVFLLAWLLPRYVFSAQWFLRLAFKKGWVAGRTTREEELAWERLHAAEIAAEENLSRGEELADAGELVGARQAFLSALQTNPNHVKAQETLVEVISRTNRVSGWCWGCAVKFLRLTGRYFTNCFFMTWIIMLLGACFLGSKVDRGNSWEILLTFAMTMMIFSLPALMRLALRQGWYK